MIVFVLVIFGISGGHMHFVGEVFPTEESCQKFGDRLLHKIEDDTELTNLGVSCVPLEVKPVRHA